MKLKLIQLLDYFRGDDSPKPPIKQVAQTPLPDTKRVELDILLIKLEQSSESAKIKELEGAFLVKASDYSKRGYNLSNQWRAYRKWHQEYYGHQLNTQK